MNNIYCLRSQASEGYVFTDVCHSICSTRGRRHQMHHGIGHMVRWGSGQPPPPGSEVNHLPPPVSKVNQFPNQGQRSTISPVAPGSWVNHPTQPGSEVNHLPRVKGQPPPHTYRNYSQWAGTTHPTGMHSCLFKIFVFCYF